jgi:predicted TPR repeat methyltransferase
MTGSIGDAHAHHQAGRLAEAESIYLELLRRDANDVDALHYLGVLRMGQGRPDEAIGLLRKALPLAPRNALIWNSLGSVLSRANNLPAAEFAFQNATQIKPDYAEAWYNLANLLRGLQRNDVAAQCYQRVIDLDPRFPGAYENVAMLLKRMGRDDLAADAYRKWLAAEPENPIARHMAAAHQTAQTPARAADGFVSQLFDRMAPNFDASLAALEYAAPGLLVAALSKVIALGAGRLVILDAGCGTGLCGPLLRSSARSLVGVDLSAGMLAKARERAVYDELHESELVTYMRARPAETDVVICADTFVYFGALEEAFGAAAEILRPGGALAFNVEAEPEDSADNFRLHGHGRYSHGERYVRSCLADSGFNDARIEPAAIRKEAGADVRGYIVVATKSSDARAR